MPTPLHFSPPRLFRPRGASVDDHPDQPLPPRSLLSSLTHPRRASISLDFHLPIILPPRNHHPPKPTKSLDESRTSASPSISLSASTTSPSSTSPIALTNVRDVSHASHSGNRKKRISTGSSVSSTLSTVSSGVFDAAGVEEVTSVSSVASQSSEFMAEGAPQDLSVAPLSLLKTSQPGTPGYIIGRISAVRKMGPRLAFIIVRDTLETIQVVLKDIPPDALHWILRLRPESLIAITGILQQPPSPILSPTTSIHHLELRLLSLRVVASVTTRLPLSNYNLPTTLRTRMANRVIDLRHPANQSLFRLRSLVTRVFRETLDEHGFIEINTPKLQPAATESGAEVFKVNYFGRRAFLAQSPQLAKQMAIGADFKRVYEISPVFRAENSNTHRHLTEYTGLDLEMVLPQDHQPLLALLDQLLKRIIHAVQSSPLLEIVRTRWPSTNIVTIDPTPIIPFIKAINMLRADGADGADVEIADLSTKDEIRLGQLVKEKYGTDLYILDKFPASARPFYAKRCPWSPAPEGINEKELENVQFTNGFDIFLRGQEISSGGQRIHDPTVLRRSLKESGIAESGMEEYLSAFDAGIPPHGGAGFGLERILMLLLELGDIRYASLFYRDPKSLPERPPALPHPEADTSKPLITLPSVADLIANYGDSTNTSWLDDRFQIWRHPSGAAVGFVPQGKIAIVTGDPLCDTSQRTEVIFAFLTFLKNNKLTPIWLLVSESVQNILVQASWRSLTCTDEQRVDNHHSTGTPRKSSVARKARRVTRSGIKIHEVHFDDALQTRVNPYITSWKAHRKGRQIHLTQVNPWVDAGHRRYFVAETSTRVHGMVAMAQLAPRHGWQVKWALDFPGAANGSIEALIEYALVAIGGPATFGVGVARKLEVGANLGGAKGIMLAKTFGGVVEGLGLGRKSMFREKFGVWGERLWICYPPRGVGILELKNLIKFFEHA